MNHLVFQRRYILMASKKYDLAALQADREDS